MQEFQRLCKKINRFCKHFGQEFRQNLQEFRPDFTIVLAELARLSTDVTQASGDFDGEGLIIAYHNQLQAQGQDGQGTPGGPGIISGRKARNKSQKEGQEQEFELTKVAQSRNNDISG